MKDVPHFNGGCTEVISPKAYCLPITTVVILKFNRTLQLKRLFSRWFWAYKMEDELPNEGLTVTLW
jgi:hypothetical protein